MLPSRFTLHLLQNTNAHKTLPKWYQLSFTLMKKHLYRLAVEYYVCLCVFGRYACMCLFVWNLISASGSMALVCLHPKSKLCSYDDRPVLFISHLCLPITLSFSHSFFFVCLYLVLTTCLSLIWKVSLITLQAAILSLLALFFRVQCMWLRHAMFHKSSLVCSWKSMLMFCKKLTIGQMDITIEVVCICMVSVKM